MNPTVSVIIPTYNRPERIQNAVRSVLNQTFQNFEIIVVDDGLRERAEKAVKQFNDERIRYIQHEVNKGGSAARNTGIKNAKAELIAFLDDDDEWYLEKLEKQYNVFKKYQERTGFVFCAIKLYYEESGIVSEQKFKKTGVHNFYEMLLAHQLRILTSSLLVKKKTIQQAGGFDEKFPSNQEWEMMIRVSRICNGYCMEDVLVKMNFLQSYHVGGSLDRRIKGREMLVNKYIDEFKKRPEVLAGHYFQLGIFCRDNREYRKAGKYFFKAWRLNKSKIMYLLHRVSLFGGENLIRILRSRR